MLLSALIYITLKVVKNMTVFMSLILILRRFTEMRLLSIFKSLLLAQMNSDFDMAYLNGLVEKVVKNMSVLCH